MKKANKLISFIIASAVLLSICALSANAQSSYGMTTEMFNVDMVVGENNVIDTTVTIRVHFNTKKHGIYYYVPYSGMVEFEENEVEYRNPYRNKIKDISVEGYDFTTSNQSGNKVIIIGNENEYLTGTHTYVIKYTCIVNDDRIDKFDYFYWNFFPLDWETPINNGTVTVTMPKEFDAQRLAVFSGIYGGTGTGKVSYRVDGRRITLSITDTLYQGETATVKVILPEGYFVGEHNYDYLSGVIILLVILSAVISTVLWYLYGRDEKIIPVVSFTPPDGMTSAETGYIVDGTVDNKDIVSLIIFWASKGYMSIKQIDKDSFEFTKLRQLPFNAKKFEQTMFNDLFASGNSVTTDQLKNKFFSTIDLTKTLLKRNFKNNPEDRIYTRQSVIAQALCSVLAIIPAASFMFINAYMQYKTPGYYLIAGILTGLLILFRTFITYLFEKKNAMKRSSYVSLMIVTVIFGIAVAAGIFAFGAFALNQPVMALVVVALSAVMSLLFMSMKKRTEKSNKWMQEILGLRDFIENAELERLNLLIEEDPEYFYNVLPFAYTLGLTDKWAKNFESIAVNPPQWYYGSYGPGYFNTVVFMSSMNHLMTVSNQNLSVRPAPSGGSSGGFGGGGGFSGGGMGGGGGGSW